MPSAEAGLSGVEAARRLTTYGPNEPAPRRRLSAIVQLFQLFANPLVIILLVASALSGALGQHADAVIIVTMVLLGVGINFLQSYRSQQAAEQLRASVKIAKCRLYCARTRRARRLRQACPETKECRNGDEESLILLNEFVGGERGIRTHPDPLNSVSYRFYNATLAVNASLAVAPCTLLHARPSSRLPVSDDMR